MYYEINVSFASSRRPQEPCRRTHDETFKGITLKEAWNAMIEHTDKPPKKCRPIYVDKANGEPEEVGFIWHKWEDDYDRPGKKYWSEMWVTLKKVRTEYLTLSEVRKAGLV